MLEQAAGALLGLLKLPIAVRQHLVVKRELVHFLAHEAQPHAERREPDAGERKQKARADREGVRVVAGGLGQAGLDEAIGAAEPGHEDH